MFEQNKNTGLQGNPLFTTVRYDNPLVSFYNMLKNGVDFDANIVDEDGNNILHHILDSSFVSNTNRRMYRDQSKTTDIEGVSLIEMLIEIYNVAIIKKVDILKKNNEGFSPLEMALKSSNHHFIKVLDNLKPSGYNAEEINKIEIKVEIYNNNYSTPTTYKNIPFVHYAVDRRDFITIGYMEKIGVDFHKKTDDGKCLYAFAATSSMFEKLIELGCDINYVNDGKTVLNYAMHLGSPSDRDGAIKLVNDKMKALIKEGGKSVVDNAIFDAAKSGTKGNFIKLVKSFSLDINKSGEDGKTPLMVALESNSPSIASHLIKEGANLHAMDKSGVHAYMYYFKNAALQNGMHADKILSDVFVEYISDVGVDVNGDSVLHHLLHHELNDKIEKRGYNPIGNAALKMKMILKHPDKFKDVFYVNNKGENFLDIIYQYDIAKMPSFRGYSYDKLFVTGNPEEIIVDISKILIKKGFKEDHEKLVNNAIYQTATLFNQLKDSLSNSEKDNYLKIVSKLLGEHSHYYSDINMISPNSMTVMNNLAKMIIEDTRLYSQFADLHARLESVTIRNGYNIEDNVTAKPSKGVLRM